MLWAHLGASWARLGASWRPLGAALARLERLLAHLGASWVRLGASLASPAAFGRLLARKTCQHKSASPASDVPGAPSPPAPPLVKEESELKRSARPALPVIRQPFGAVRWATIPLQTSPYLKIFILRSHPVHNVPRRDRIAKALPVIRQRSVKCAPPPSPSRPPPI